MNNFGISIYLFNAFHSVLRSLSFQFSGQFRIPTISHLTQKMSGIHFTKFIVKKLTPNYAHLNRPFINTLFLCTCYRVVSKNSADICTYSKVTGSPPGGAVQIHQHFWNHIHQQNPDDGYQAAVSNDG